METKNKLYFKRNKGSNPELQWYNYKMYHNMFNHVMRKTARNIIGIYVQLKIANVVPIYTYKTENEHAFSN